MSFRKSALLLVVAVTVAVSNIFLPASLAQEQGGNGLQISPTRTDLTAQPGEQKTFSLMIKNITGTNLTIRGELNDFESDQETGTPKLRVHTQERTPYTLEKMLKGLQDVDLKAGETKELKFTLDVPSTAAPGAYFGAVRYQVVPGNSTPDSDRQVALNASIAHLVFLEIPGEVNEQIKIEDFNILHDNRPGSFFVQKPDKASVKVSNLGNGFSRPFGTVTISRFNKQVYSYEMNKKEPRGIVLPNSSRVFTDEIKNVSVPGKYQALASLSYGSGGEIVNYKVTFWYLPAWFLAIIAALLIVAGIGGYLLYRRRFVKTKRRR